jgi:hypothetical protein
MEWLQVGVLIGIFVVWAAAVLAVLAIVSMGRDRDDAGEEPVVPLRPYRDGQGQYQTGVRPILGVK